jgi:HK97 family phage portal protein
MAFWNKAFQLIAARLKKQPDRETWIYPQLQAIGQYNNKRAFIKQTPANLRYFSRTIFARRGIKALKDPITLLNWDIVPIKGTKLSPELERQITVVKECFKRPNNDDSFSTLIEKMIEDYCVYGAGVCELQLSNNPIRPIFLFPVEARSIQIYADWDGSKTLPRYLQTLSLSNVGISEGVALRNDELVYIVCNPSNETPYGYGPVEIAFTTISRILGVESYCGKVTSNAIPETLLWVGPYSNNELSAFRAYWENEIEGQGKMPLVGGQSEFKAIKLHSGNDDALYLKYQEFLIRCLATAFSLSPQNFNIQSDTNRSTAEVAEDRDWDQAIKPLAALFAEYFTREIIQRKLGFYQLEFQWCALDREDELATAQIYEYYFKNNAITPNEQRERIGLPPMENNWGDKTYADVEIEIAAARGVGAIEDPDIIKKTPKKSAQNKRPKGNNDE